jgi:hypothetical protein
MDDPMQSPQAENPALLLQTGTVEDVRPVPPLDPKDLPEHLRKTFEDLSQFLQNPQVGGLKDNSTQDYKTFKANLSSALKKGDDVYYQDLPESSSHDAQVIGKV